MLSETGVFFDVYRSTEVPLDDSPFAVIYTPLKALIPALVSLTQSYNIKPPSGTENLSCPRSA